MKARKVKGLDPLAPLSRNAALILSERLDEMRGFAPNALEEERVEDQHDMRIAAKRLRYILEITEQCFGPEAKKARRWARDLQGILGDIHDCDVMLPRVEQHWARVRRADPRAVRGLEVLAVHLRTRRKQLHNQFRDVWAEQERNGIWDRLARALSERA